MNDEFPFPGTNSLDPCCQSPDFWPLGFGSPFRYETWRQIIWRRLQRLAVSRELKSSTVSSFWRFLFLDSFCTNPRPATPAYPDAGGTQLSHGIASLARGPVWASGVLPFRFFAYRVFSSSDKLLLLIIIHHHGGQGMFSYSCSPAVILHPFLVQGAACASQPIISPQAACRLDYFKSLGEYCSGLQQQQS
jgi:hypothetical protein